MNIDICLHIQKPSGLILTLIVPFRSQIKKMIHLCTVKKLKKKKKLGLTIYRHCSKN